MKPRRWILIAALIVASIAGALWFGLQSVERSRRIEEALVTHLSPLVGGAFEVDKVRIGFFSVYLSNVQISIPVHSFEFKVQDIKVGISLLKLLRSGGDIRRSISKVILLQPEIQVALRSNISIDTPALGEADTVARGDIGNLTPVDLLVRDGMVRVSTDRGSYTMAERLDGRLHDEEGGGLAFEMRGRLGARRRNLSMSGVFSAAGSRHRVSIRLDRARIVTPIQWNRFVVTAGTLDGVCEILFGESLSPEDLEASGWIAIREGEAGLEGAAPTLSDFDLAITLSDTRVHLDSLCTRWEGLRICGDGVWDLSTTGRGHLAFHCSRIDPGSLFPDMPPFFKENLLGHGQVLLEIDRPAGARILGATVEATGFSAWGEAITRARAEGRLEGTTATLDTLIVGGGRANLMGRGVVEYGESPPVFSTYLHLAMGADMVVPGMQGQLNWKGTVRGLGQEVKFDCALSGDSLRLHGFDLGSADLRVIGDGRSMQLGTLPGAGHHFQLSGRIDSLFTDPCLNLVASLEGEPVDALLGALPWNWGRGVAGASLRTEIVGPISSFVSSSRLHFAGTSLTGGLNIRMRRRPQKMDGIDWEVSDSALSLNGTPFPLQARGVVSEQRLQIEALSAFQGISGKGEVLMLEPPSVSLDLACTRVPLPLVDGAMLGGGGLLRAGLLDGVVRLRGNPSEPSVRLRARVRDGDVGGFHPLNTDIVLSGEGRRFVAQPFVVRKGSGIFLAVDTVVVADSVRCSGSFWGVELAHLLNDSVTGDIELSGTLGGTFATTGQGFPLRVEATAPRIGISSWGLDSVALRATVDHEGMEVVELTASDGKRSRLVGRGVMPWTFLRGRERETDTLRAALQLSGDLLATLQNGVDGPIGGTGIGEMNLAFTVTSEEWRFSQAHLTVPRGRMTLFPFVQDTIEEFRVSVKMDDSARVHTDIRGRIRRRPISITSLHAVPQEYEPIMLGPVSLGVLQVMTPEGGIALHLPGFMEPGELGEAEFAGRKPFDAFALSGPVEKLKITGKWVIRNLEFTFPLLEEEVLPWDWDPYPYVTWNMDVVVGNRRVVYFYDVAFRRRFLRFLEAYLEPGSEVRVRGRMIDNTFRLLGGVRANRGEIFYGKVFDRNFQAGCDFEPVRVSGQGYDNLPIIWGSVEALSDTSRFDRVKLTIMVRDSATGALATKGRFKDIEFRLSSRFEEIPGESERAFYRAAGLRFSSFEGAGEFVSDFGEQYLHRYLLQRFERRLAKRLGLDVISFETSIASNYFNYLYNRQLDDLGAQWDNLAFGNVGITVGRYFFRDKLFLKWRTELVPTDTLLHPEHSVGLEYQPFRFLLFEAGTEMYRGQNVVDFNPSLRMRLRVPLKRSK